MRILLAALILNVCTTGSFEAADTSAIKPFHAQYATFRNGDDVGRTTLDLVDNGDGSWTLQSETRGTSGLAKLAGVHIIERSRFRWKDARPEALEYDYRQDAAFKQKTRRAVFDWKSGDVHVTEGNDNFHYAIVPGLIDRQTVTLAIATDLLRGASPLDYQVAVKDRVETMRYTRGDQTRLNVPAGQFVTIPARRVGDTASDRMRVATSWFAPSLGWLPVKIEQTQKKGDTVTLELISSDVPRG